MKKYKHKPTGRVFTTKLLGENKVEGIEWGDWNIPMWVAKDSLDWEEVKEPLFKTWNGKSIYSRQPFWLVRKEDWQIEEHLDGIEHVDFAGESEQDETITFTSRLSAEKYIEENKPQFSLSELVACVNNWSMVYLEDEYILKFIEKCREKK